MFACSSATSRACCLYVFFPTQARMHAHTHTITHTHTHTQTHTQTHTHSHTHTHTQTNTTQWLYVDRRKTCPSDKVAFQQAYDIWVASTPPEVSECVCVCVCVCACVCARTLNCHPVCVSSIATNLLVIKLRAWDRVWKLSMIQS